MPIDSKVSITKEYIFSKITQEQIFERYLGLYPDVTRTYANPLRKDIDPGCRFYYDSRNVLKFNDFGQHWNWDCFNVIQHKENCSFVEALQIVARDFNVDSITLTIQQELNFKRPVRIEIASVEWNKETLEYWKQYNIDKDTLRLFNVKPIKAYWLNGIRYNIGRKENAYAYCFTGGKIKIYLPDREYNRFYQNASYLMQGWEQLPEKGEAILITKSYKDVISLYTFGISAIAPLSENQFLDVNDYRIISDRFDSKFLLYDNDFPGRRNMVRILKKHEDLISLLFPIDMQKDWTDNLKKYGNQFMIDLLEDTKQRFYE